jgi:hypothetical protein
MAKSHGTGPKCIFVGTYLRWKNGRCERVTHYTRGASPKLHFRTSDLQIDFGF